MVRLHHHLGHRHQCHQCDHPQDHHLDHRQQFHQFDHPQDLHHHCHCHWPVEMESLSPLHLIKGFSLNDHQNKTGNSEEQKKLILEGGLTLFPCKER